MTRHLQVLVGAHDRHAANFHFRRAFGRFLLFDVSCFDGDATLLTLYDVIVVPTLVFHDVKRSVASSGVDLEYRLITENMPVSKQMFRRIVS